MSIVDPVPLMIFYLDGGKELTSDEREILLFALYCETKSNKDGLVQQALKQMSRKPRVNEPAVTQRTEAAEIRREEAQWWADEQVEKDGELSASGAIRLAEIDAAAKDRPRTSSIAMNKMKPNELMAHEIDAAAPPAVTRPEGCICSEAYGVGPANCPAHRKLDVVAKKKIVAMMQRDTWPPYSTEAFPFIPRVYSSDHPRFIKGTRLDYGFLKVALTQGYTVTIIPPNKWEISNAIAEYEKVHGPQDWIDWRPTSPESAPSEGAK